MRGDQPFGIDEDAAMDFPITELMDESACYEFLVRLLHPDGLACPHCGDGDRLKVHRRDRDPILVYRCIACRRIFNAFTGTTLRGTKRRPVELVLILRGIAQGVSTAQLARELGCSRPELLEFRHRLQELAFANLDRTPLADAAIEADEMFQNAGEKGRPAPRRGGPAEATGQPGGGPWHLGEGPSAGVRGGRTPERPGATARRTPDGSSDAGAGGRRVEPRGGDGLQRRVAGLCAPGGAGPGPRHGVPRDRRMGSGR
jgi:transposase-like protein